MRERFYLRKIAIVTGGTRGLGICVARELLARGAAVAVCARDADEVASAERDLERRGEVLAAVCDVTKPDELARFVARVDERFGRIDMLFNVAGTIVVAPFADTSMADVRDVMETNFFAPANAMDAVLPYLRKRNRSNIVNVASVGGIVAVPHLAAYSASKFALNGYSQVAHAELRREGVRVTVVNPGLMRTGSPMNATFKGRTQAEYGWFALSDALPLLSISSTSAARRICDAARRGDPFVVLGLPAHLAALAHGLAPGAIVRAMTLVSRFLLPAPTGDRSRYARGHQSESAVAPSPLTVASDRAAHENNEFAAKREVFDLPG